MVKKEKCDFSKMGTRIIPKKGKNLKKIKKIAEDRKKRIDEFRKWWS